MVIKKNTLEYIYFLFTSNIYQTKNTDFYTFNKCLYLFCRLVKNRSVNKKIYVTYTKF